MRERALLIGADLQIKSAPGEGVTVRLSIPRAAAP
jgi:signal transduction histidine kinase